MRVTQHLVSAADYLGLRPALQPALTRWAEAVLRRRAPELELAALADVGPAVLRRAALGHRAAPLLRRACTPGADAEAMAIAVRVHLPLVQVPVEGAPWGVPGNPAFVNADTWLGRPVPAATGPEALVLHYLAAFGPARVGRRPALVGCGSPARRGRAAPAPVAQLPRRAGARARRPAPRPAPARRSSGASLVRPGVGQHAARLRRPHARSCPRSTANPCISPIAGSARRR